jgi:hypothetical protein
VTSVFARTFYRLRWGQHDDPRNPWSAQHIYPAHGIWAAVPDCAGGHAHAGSINYNNNLGFLLTFLLGSLGLTAMMHTFAMLYGLRLTAATATPVFAGTPVEIEISVAGIRPVANGHSLDH